MNPTLNFNDLFKSSFLEKVTSFSLIDTMIAFSLALVLGLFIYAVYKKTFTGVMYSASFGVSLIAMTLVTTLIIIAISSNVILSLGMVGALSIVRFRTAVKEPIDIAFLFWAISAGIVLGAGLIPLAIFGSLFIGGFMVIFVNKKSVDNPYILVLNCSNDQGEQQGVEYIRSQVKRHVIKSKSVHAHKGIELTMEIRLNNMTTQFMNELTAIDGVSNAVLVSYNGDYMG